MSDKLEIRTVNPIKGDDVSVDVSKSAMPAPKPYEVFTYCAPPLCFISSDYEATTVHKDNLEFRQNLTVCKMSVANGGGYNMTRLPMDRITRYTLATSRLLCLAPKGDLTATVKPSNFTDQAPVKGPDTEDYLQRMWNFLPQANGFATLPFDAKPLASAAFVTRCGANTKTLSVYSNGLATLVEVQGGITTLKNVDVALLSEVAYIRYVKAPLAQAICFGKTNHIELVFAGDTYVMGTNAAADSLPAFHDGIKAALLGRNPSGNIKTVSGAASSIEIGPEFTTVTSSECGWAGDQCKTIEVTTIKTRDISHLRATLPSWINALIRAIRDIEFAALGAACSRLMADDLVLLPVWPCAFLNDSWVAIVLTFNALMSIMKFLIIFFFRKTAVILGGPGPAKTVVLPVVVEKPEEMLQDLANGITVAQASFTWPLPGQATPPASGVAKSVV